MSVCAEAGGVAHWQDYDFLFVYAGSSAQAPLLAALTGYRQHRPAPLP